MAVPIGYRYESKTFIAAARAAHRANRHNVNNQWDHSECIICSAYSHDDAYRVRTRYVGHRADYRYLAWWWQVEERLETINADPRSVVAFQICLKICRMTPTRWEWDWIVLLEVGGRRQVTDEITGKAPMSDRLKTILSLAGVDVLNSVLETVEYSESLSEPRTD